MSNYPKIPDKVRKRFVLDCRITAFQVGMLDTRVDVVHQPTGIRRDGKTDGNRGRLAVQEAVLAQVFDLVKDQYPNPDDVVGDDDTDSSDDE